MKDSLNVIVIKQKIMLPYVNQKANIAECFDYFFLLVHTYSSEITSKEQSHLDIGTGGIFLKA